MKPNTKIFLSILLWLVITGGMFFFAIPKLAKSLTDLQTGHKTQLETLNKLKAQASSLEKMRQELNNQKSQKVQSTDFFSGDLDLVNEIKKMEDNANKAGVKIVLTIPESADKAKPLAGSLSGLYVVPYTLLVTGDFPSYVKFVEYMENSFFVSPFTGMNLSVKEEVGLETQVQGNFYIKKSSQ